MTSRQPRVAGVHRVPMGKLRLSEVAWLLGLGAGFRVVVRLSAWTAQPLGASARGGLLWGAPGEPGRGAGCPYPWLGPGREQCGLYPPSWPAQAGCPQHGARGRAACPRGGLAPGPARPPASSPGRLRSGQTLRLPPPSPAGPASGDGFGGPAHPPLPRLPPSQHPRASFKNSRWAGPSRSGRLWPPLPGS